MWSLDFSTIENCGYTGSGIYMTMVLKNGKKFKELLL